MADWPDVAWLAGCVDVIRSNPVTGLLAAGLDLRRTAYAIVS